MNTRKQSMLAVSAARLALLICGATATGWAQTPKPSAEKMPQHREGVKGRPASQGMSEMMRSPHHVLAMAYMDNLATFARALRANVTQSKSVNLDLARPAVTEMRRNFGQMKEHYQGQMTAMGDHTDPPMSSPIRHMKTRIALLGEHLSALETEVNASMPDREKVVRHATAIVKECAEMSAMPSKSKAHQMR